MTRLCLLFLVLAATGCSSILTDDDLRSYDYKGIVVKKTRTADEYYLHVQRPDGEQVKYEVSKVAYGLLGEGDSLPIASAKEEAVGEIDEESVREGDGSEFTNPDAPSEGEDD